MGLYADAEKFLEPAQELVDAMLIIIVVVSLILLFSQNNVVRTAWVTYMFMP